MIDAELGQKLVCPSCAVKFYDLMKSPAQCPKCGNIFTPEPILPSKEDRPPETEESAEDKAAKDDGSEAETLDDSEADVVSLEDIDEDDDPNEDDDEMAAVKDVGLVDDDDKDSVGDDDDTFLEIDDNDDSNVSDLVRPPSSSTDE